MKNSNNSSSSGLGICSDLTIIFVVLKLIGSITWSWWWVLSPLWIGTGLWLIAVVVISICLAYARKK